MIWEYLKSSYTSAAEMNRLGAEGWELVAATQRTANAGDVGVYLFWKRPAALSSPKGQDGPT